VLIAKEILLDVLNKSKVVVVVVVFIIIIINISSFFSYYFVLSKSKTYIVLCISSSIIPYIRCLFLWSTLPKVEL
jgi:hypothetical protein